jgi:hypothetical protein
VGSGGGAMFSFGSRACCINTVHHEVSVSNIEVILA